MKHRMQIAENIKCGKLANLADLENMKVATVAQISNRQPLPIWKISN